MKALIFKNKVIDIAEVEFEVHPQMTWMDCPDDCKAGEWELVDGNLQAIPEPEDTRTYAEKRATEYPQIGDQLDDLFHKGAFSTEMAATLQAVKDKYPKP